MRLVVLGPGHPFRGGIAATTTELVRTLCQRGHDVEFLTPRRQYIGGLYPGADDRDPEACAPLPCAERCLEPMWPPAWPRMRGRAVAADGAVWIIPYWTWVWAGWWRYLLQGSPGRPPTVGIVHNPADHDAGALERVASELVLDRCDALFTHAQVLASDLEERYPGVPVDHHPLPVPSSVSRLPRAQARAALGLAAGDRLALFLGFIRRYKGVDVVLSAMAELPESSPWRLIVAGEAWGRLGEALTDQLAQLRLGGRVDLRLGWVREEEAQRLLAAADLVVLPYRNASQSAVAPLALAHGVPVLSTTVGGLPEVIVDGRSGHLVPPEDPAAIARVLNELDEPALQRLREGVVAERDRLSWGAYAARLEQLIDRII